MNYKLSDNVLARIVQIVQEGMMMGIDVTDLMRQIELEQSDSEPSQLVLTTLYKSMVEHAHEEYLERAKLLKEEGN